MQGYTCSVPQCNKEVRWRHPGATVALDAGLQVNVWTVNSLAGMHANIELGGDRYHHRRTCRPGRVSLDLIAVSAPRPQTMRMRRASWIVLLVFVVGCSGLMQNIGARWVTRQLASEFDLNDQQTAETRASVNRLIAKAPSVIGPRVDMLVATTDRAMAKGLTDRDLMSLERQLDKLLDAVAGPVIDEAAPILATLSDAQIDHAAARFEERFDEVREKLEQPADERLERRQDKFVEAIEEWTDDLSESQITALRTYVTRFPDEGALQLKADEARVGEIETVLRQHSGAQSVRDVLWKAWTEREDWGPEARSPAERRAESRRTLLYIYGLMTPTQKEHARGHLHELHDRVKRFLGLVDS